MVNSGGASIKTCGQHTGFSICHSGICIREIYPCAQSLPIGLPDQIAILCLYSQDLPASPMQSKMQLQLNNSPALLLRQGDLLWKFRAKKAAIWNFSSQILYCTYRKSSPFHISLIKSFPATGNTLAEYSTSARKNEEQSHEKQHSFNKPIQDQL